MPVWPWRSRPSGFGKSGAEGDVPGLAVEIGLDRADLADLRELVAVGQHEFDCLRLLLLFRVGHVFEVAGLGDVEIHPHHAVVGQAGEDVPLLDQASLPLFQAVDDAVERSCDLVKFNSAVAKFALACAFASLAWCSATSC